MTLTVDGAAEEWLSSVVRHTAELIIVVDATGTVIYANPAATDTFGISVEQAVGTTGFQYLYPDDVHRATTRLGLLVGTPGGSLSDSLRFRTVSGEIRTLEIVATNCLELPSVQGIVINGRDVTERDDYVGRLAASLTATTRALGSAVQVRDPYTAGHQRDVAEIAIAIARQLALPDDDVKGIEVASVLHDIGKIAVPTEILTKPGKLSAVEYEMVKTHPQVGADIIADVPFPWPVADMILQHHERLDGSGYPHGLRGNAILTGSRVLAVADVVSAMSSHRPYRPALGLPAALAELTTNSPSLYDPDVVHACTHLYATRALPGPPHPTELTVTPVAAMPRTGACDES